MGLLLRRKQNKTQTVGKTIPWETELSTARPSKGRYLVRCEGVDVLQQRLPHLRAALEHAGELGRRQLQEHAERLRLRPLAALDETFPHLRILPHLQRTGSTRVTQQEAYRLIYFTHSQCCELN